ncbi:MAG: hypothetical protein SXV54_18715 [Chloroflexota bacterium]|nr:hypothetical protein [Chloroflexota bacterium]
MTRPNVASAAPPQMAEFPSPALLDDPASIVTVGVDEEDTSSAYDVTVTVVSAVSPAVAAGISVATVLEVAVACAGTIGLAAGVAGVSVAVEIGDDVAVVAIEVGVGVSVMGAVGGGLVGCGCGGGLVGGGDVGVAGPGVGVRVGTVPCRARLCPGAAHRSGPATIAAINVPAKKIQNPYLFLLLTVASRNEV